MTSLIRSSITGLYHPKRSLDRIRSSSSSSVTDNPNSSLSTPMKTSAIDRILHADKSGGIYQLNHLIINIYSLGFLPTDSSSNSSRSFSNIDLSNSSASSLEQSVLEAQIKRANSCNETMEATIKRLRTESQNSTEDLINKNEVNFFFNIFFSITFFFSIVFRTFTSRIKNKNFRIRTFIR